LTPKTQLSGTSASGQGLGSDFLDQLDYLLERIASAPFQFPEIHPNIRRGLLKRFPYSVYFSADEEQVEIIAVLHQRRHPDTWRGRM
jgi:plasmid stabilization system protein ParE